MEKIISLLNQHNEWRKSCINLIASENVMSPLCERLYVSDLMHRYAEGTPFKRFYQGLKYIDEIEQATRDEFKEHFKVDFCDVRPISGTIANYAVFSALAQRGDRILSLGVENGSHVSHEKAGAAGILGLEVENLVYGKDCVMDVEKSIERILDFKPKFIVIGGSVILFPQPVKELKEACDKIGAKIVYDAAHVLGLIAAGLFQDPLGEGADIVTTSTHKTFPGPQGGLILGNVGPDLGKMIELKIFPGFSSNHHLHRIPALYMALKEMQKFGSSYAGQTIKNAQALAQELHNYGFAVLGRERGFTQSHQVVVDCKEIGRGSQVARYLEEANIIINKNIIPGDEQSPKDPSGIRLGTQEMTRFGMKEDEMKEIAKFIKLAILDKKDTNSLKKEVIGFRQNFQKTKFCLTNF